MGKIVSDKKSQKETGDEKSREDLDLGSDQELKPMEGDSKEDNATDQEIIDKQFEPGGMGAPALISERSKSERPKPPESRDIEYLSHEEVALDDRVNTLTTILVEYPDAPNNYLGPFIERCMGRNPESRKLMVARVPAKEVPILPNQVVRYLGHVVQDHLAVHTARVKHNRRAWGYSFDRFYVHNRKRLARVCYIPDRMHQAAIVYEKMVDKKSHKAYSRIRQIRGPMKQSTGQPMYEIVGVKEDYYRDLKRLFERYFIERGDESLVGDPALKVLLSSIHP